MKELIDALTCIKYYDNLPLDEFISIFEAFTGQKISKDVIQKFIFTGLSNTDLATSDFLEKNGLNNLFNFLNKFQNNDN